jgi:two-component system, sensor histidine kinase and response regulator
MQSVIQTAIAQHPKDTMNPEPPTHRLRVLVAEDAECSQRIVDGILDTMNLEVDVAESGRVACDMAEIAKAEGRPYDLILVDMEMPKTNGQEAARWLHARDWHGTIVGVSDHASESDRKESLVNGCDDFIPKPITNTEIREVFSRYLNLDIEKILNTDAKKAEALGDAGKQRKPQGRALLVEDARCIQMHIGSMLRNMNMEVDTAENGRVGCDKAMVSKAEGMPYDVILMDMQMPKMNGRQAAKWLREHGWEGPIVAVSIHASDKDHAEFLSAGCDAYIAKPVTEGTLREVLARYLVLA